MSEIWSQFTNDANLRVQLKQSGRLLLDFLRPKPRPNATYNSSLLDGGVSRAHENAAWSQMRFEFGRIKGIKESRQLAG